jgi:PleD family two-component response regulator
LKSDFQQRLMDTKPISVLVIDGDTASRKYLIVMLRKRGYTILSASLGREGLLSAWKNQPDIIILDPVLPDVPGLELVNHLHQDRRTSTVPCVALSSQHVLQDINALLSAGCSDYIAYSSQALPGLLELILRLLRGSVHCHSYENGLDIFKEARYMSEAIVYSSESSNWLVRFDEDGIRADGQLANPIDHAIYVQQFFGCQ